VPADGSLAEEPIALVEVQGYVYLAKVTIADVYAAFGDRERAAALRDRAGTLRERFNEAFWTAEEGPFALAPDGRKVAGGERHLERRSLPLRGIVGGRKAGAAVNRMARTRLLSGCSW